MAFIGRARAGVHPAHPPRVVGLYLTGEESTITTGYTVQNGGYTYGTSPFHDPGIRVPVVKRRPTGSRPVRSRERAKRHDGLPSLSIRLESAREEERARVARELHDELGQVLTSLKLEFMSLVDRLRESEPKPGVQLVNKLQSLIGLIEISIQSVRRIASDLRPALLDHFGLKEAIQWEATKFQARTGIRCRVTWGLKRELTDQTQQLALYRILQEALTNVVKHAHAGAVRITVRQASGNVALVIQDNGRGIKRDELINADALGLLGMNERARLLGGRVTIDSTLRKGTSVRARIPLNGAMR